jgi:hypothetical protein
MNPSHPCSSYHNIVDTVYSRDIIVDVQHLKHQAKLIAEVQQAHEEHVAVDEQEEEDAISKPAAMQVLYKPLRL